MRQQEIEETPGLGFSVGLSAPQRPKELPSLLTTNQEFEYSMQSSLRKPRDRKITLRRKPSGSRFAATASGKVELERHSRKGESQRRREKSRSLANSWYPQMFGEPAGFPCLNSVFLPFPRCVS